MLKEEGWGGGEQSKERGRSTLRLMPCISEEALAVYESPIGRRES